MSRGRSIILLLLLIVAGGAGAAYYVYLQRHPTTSDAYLGMHVVRIAPQVSGAVATVPVKNHQSVKAGEVLFTIDAAPFALAVQQATARLQQAKDALASADAQVTAANARVLAAQAAATEAERHAARVRDLVAKHAASRDEGDAAERARLDARDTLAAAQAELAAAAAQRGAVGDANAAVKVAEAALGQARLDLAHTQITAPADGIVAELDLRPGGFVAAGIALFALVETGEVWVDANFKETDLPRIRAGQPARVTVDLLPGQTFHGEVQSLSPASGTAFSLLPPENATGNWVKVTQRFPVRVRLLDPVPGLRVGASSVVTVDTVAPDLAMRGSTP